ncbi:hypothetical protein PG996_008199 [Apiospora saccharicola]|uniref:Uncharacterized protein n=1 Tax=Apiospora saccharicola TaxID=335842 RepID=A0ABR1UXX4_9PEZI
MSLKASPPESDIRYCLDATMKWPLALNDDGRCPLKQSDLEHVHASIHKLRKGFVRAGMVEDTTAFYQLFWNVGILQLVRAPSESDDHTHAWNVVDVCVAGPHQNGSLPAREADYHLQVPVGVRRNNVIGLYIGRRISQVDLDVRLRADLLGVVKPCVRVIQGNRHLPVPLV